MNSFLHRAAKFAKSLDYKNKGVTREDVDFLELKNFLNTVSMQELRSATEELYELANRRPYGSLLVELAKVMHNMHERRRGK